MKKKPNHKKFETLIPVQTAVQYDKSWLEDYIKVVSQMTYFLEKGGQNLVSFHKRKLGRQDITLNLSHRCWVWSRDSWTVFVSNKGGISLEVPPGTTKKQALKIWESYKRFLGL
jgi:hypothetical protein